ncbi:NUDIX hydrolase [Microcoleus sp. FACHB-1515]|uniref:NUDIX hydrolase n=1 Tax=Cyanophyceae TaxID=3028117 RepID=UPI001688685B|nr:NUDIX hydrolase [Microcoleus sp. FACHB-1515]MBD2089256.1 NUDIX hydrolase [Microcoleus sp. FACHB-1515]
MTEPQASVWPPRSIRVIALGLIQDGDRLFVGEGFDRTKQQTFYRALGGGVEFGETSEVALQREFEEEVGAALTNIRYLATIENIFTFNGNPGHEIIQLYRCDFVDRHLYEQDSVLFTEGDFKKTAVWVAIDRFLSGELRLVPEQCLQYLSRFG